MRSAIEYGALFAGYGQILIMILSNVDPLPFHNAIAINLVAAAIFALLSKALLEHVLPKLLGKRRSGPE
jgi:hypothetical protein